MLVASLTSVIFTIVTLPPLSAAQRDMLASARDGGEYHDDAFAALIDDVRSWTAADVELIVKAGVALAPPDIAKLLRDPAVHRGELFTIRGELQQKTDLPPPYEDAQEWFVRDSAGKPIAVYVVQAHGTVERDADHRANIKIGETIEIIARFHKRIELAARDGKLHEYPSFVGAFPLAVAPANASRIAMSSRNEFERLWLIAGPIAFMLIVFVALMFYSARRRKSCTQHRLRHRAAFTKAELQDESQSAALDAGANLPDDPAEALTIMRRNADGFET